MVLLGPQLEDALSLRMEGSDGDNCFEGWEFVGDTQDCSESTGLEEKDGDVRMAKAGQIPLVSESQETRWTRLTCILRGRIKISNRKPDKTTRINTPIESDPKLSYNGTSAFP